MTTVAIRSIVEMIRYANACFISGYAYFIFMAYYFFLSRLNSPFINIVVFRD
jgi:hypothetical protein